MTSGHDTPLLGYFGHHKSASTWFQVICGEVCRELRVNYRIVHLASHVDNDLKGFVGANNVEFVAYTNADYAQVRQLLPVRGFHVVRDPRDICVSAYFSHKYSHDVSEGWKAMQEHRKKLQEVSEEEGLLLEIDWLQHHFDEMRTWKEANAGILELRMEDIIDSPYQYFLEIFEHLGLIDNGDYTPSKRAYYLLSKSFRKLEALSGHRVHIPISPKRLPAERVLGIVWEHGFRRKTKGRELGQEDQKSHYRKGVAGDWKNHFNQRHVDYFKEKCNDLLLYYGYETDPDWPLP